MSTATASTASASTTTTGPDGLQVEIWSDIACPWCYIGKRRFESALAAFPHAGSVDVVWRSFELDPNATSDDGEPVDQAARLALKYGMSREQAQQRLDQLTAAAADEGLTYRLDQSRGGNTFDAHRLLHLAATESHELQGALKERLLAARFTEGAAIADHDTLVQLAEEVGLDGETVRATLAGDTYAEDVRRDEWRAQALGITGVPFFVLGGQYGVSGAQSSEVMLQALTAAHAALNPLTMVTNAANGDEGDEAEQCEGDACAI